MEAIKHPNCTTVAVGDDCYDLPVEERIAFLAPEKLGVKFSSFWVISKEDLEALREGAVVRVSLFGGQPPIQVQVVPPERYVESDEEEVAEALKKQKDQEGRAIPSD